MIPTHKPVCSPSDTIWIFIFLIYISRWRGSSISELTLSKRLLSLVLEDRVGSSFISKEGCGWHTERVRMSRSTWLLARLIHHSNSIRAEWDSSPSANWGKYWWTAKWLVRRCMLGSSSAVVQRITWRQRETLPRTISATNTASLRVHLRTLAFDQERSAKISELEHWGSLYIPIAWIEKIWNATPWAIGNYRILGTHIRHKDRSSPQPTPSC